jgi:hypothetical protein
MLKFSKVGVLMAVLAFSGLLASSASAAEWHTNGPLEATSTNAGASRLAIHSGGSVVVVQCTTSSGTVTLRGPTIAGSTAPGIATVQPIFGGPCTVSGAAGYSVACNEAELNANSYTGGTTFASAGTGVTTGTITNIDCRISIGATACSTVTGTVSGHYINPHILTGAGGFGRLTVTAAGQSLTVSKIGAGCVALPHGAGTFGSPGAGSTVGNLTYQVDGTHAPWLFRTA